MSKRILGPALAGLLIVGGCAPIAPAPQIPPMPAERVPAPPRSSVTLIFEPGHWLWDGAAYEWAEGQWVPRGTRRLWVDGTWRRSGATWVWEQAHWL